MSTRGYALKTKTQEAARYRKTGCCALEEAWVLYGLF